MSSTFPVQKPIFSPEFFSFRGGFEKHIHVNAEGTLILNDTPSTQEERLRVNQRLSQVIKKIQDKSSLEYHSLKAALRRPENRAFGANVFHCRILLINNAFAKENSSNLFVRAMLCVINFVRRFFGYSEISQNRYQLIDTDAADHVAKSIKEILIDEHIKFANLSLTVSANAPKILNKRNLQALELGFAHDVVFKHGSNHFKIDFDPKNKTFTLGFSGPNNSFDEFRKQWALTKTERTYAHVLNQTTGVKYEIPYEITYHRKHWLSGKIDVSHKMCKPIPLRPNEVYEIQSPSDNPLTFEITKR